MAPSRSKSDRQRCLSKPYELPSSSVKSDSRKTTSIVASFLKIFSLPSQLPSFIYQQPSIEPVIQSLCGSFRPYVHLYYSLAHTAQIQNIVLNNLPERSVPSKTCSFARLPNVVHNPYRSFDALDVPVTQEFTLYSSRLTVASGVHVDTRTEYIEEIAEYMNNLEEDMMPDPEYMKSQKDITWVMRQMLVDWLLRQAHFRWHLLPETLWVAVNLMDRFFTRRNISPTKLPVVGITALMVAAKYEEGRAPSINEFLLITNNSFTKEEILKSECVLLQTLEFKISQCSPYTWIHRISVNADNYETRTRMLGTFLAETTLLNCRFLRCKPSLIAAIGMYSARRMLGRDWNALFAHHSGFVAEQLEPGHRWICENLTEENFASRSVCQIYATEGISSFAIEWARLRAVFSKALSHS